MPKVLLPLDETQESITRPVVFQILRDLLPQIRLSFETKIIY